MTTKHQVALEIWHHEWCSSSRKAMEWLSAHFDNITVRDYMTDTPSSAELESMLSKAGLTAEQLVRKKEPLFEKRFNDKAYTHEEWLHILRENPVLIERPVIIVGNKAWLGRPFEAFVQKITEEINR